MDTAELSDREKLRILADEVAFVIGAYRSGDLKCKTMIDTSDEEAESYPMVTLEERLLGALAKCKIYLKK